MTTADVHGPVDFVLIEFKGRQLTGRAAQELLDLVDRGIIRVYDILVIGKAEDGSTFAVDLAASPDEIGAFTELSWARTGLVTEEDTQEAAGVLEPGTLAVLVVYENTWAIPFVAAAREAGGELVAGARIPAQDVMDALAELDALESA